MSPEAIKSLDVRNANGDMLPMGTFVTIKDTLGPQMVQRYNMYTTAQINGEPAPGFSSGQAMTLVEQMAAETLPASMGYEWTAMSFQEKLVGNEQFLIFALAIVLVYLVLAAFPCRSWTSPAAVIAVVPLAALGVVIALAMRGADNNIYTQVGVVLLIALASKNAILIVEFAIELRNHGKSIVEAARESSKLRLPRDCDDLDRCNLGVHSLVDFCQHRCSQSASRRERGGRRYDHGHDLLAAVCARLLCDVSQHERMGLQSAAQPRSEYRKPLLRTVLFCVWPQSVAFSCWLEKIAQLIIGASPQSFDRFLP